MIKFEKVRFKNFGSFGNTMSEIILDKNSTTLICGNNGSGKSFAFLDSITFALFGKPFRKINIPQLANSINQKGCIVEIEFSRGSDKFLVRRGMSPRLFEIHKNGTLIDQEASSTDYQDILEQQILKMNYKTFTQVVILGSSSFVPFMQLSSADRRAVIENILDIDIFSTMNVVLKGKILAIKEAIKDLNSKIELEKNKISIQKNYIFTLEKKNIEDSDDKEIRIAEIDKRIAELWDSIIAETSTEETDISTAETAIHDILESIKEQHAQLAVFDSNKKRIEGEVKFFKTNEMCPVCSQKISDKLKKDKILSSMIGISDAQNQLSETKNIISTLEGDVLAKKLSLKKIRETNSELKAKRTEINNLESEKSRIQDTLDKSSILNELNKEREKLIKLEASLQILMDEKLSQSNDMMYHELANELLMDGGVKGKIIKYYLPHMNSHINRFLSAMDFFVQFNMDEEFNEQIKSRHRDEFSYMNFSEGEKMRIDLALLLAWREIARMKNSVNCNLLILDEVFDSSLDSVGMDELMKLLKIVSDKANVYVISHKADQLVDKFSNIITFEKKNNFSKIIYN